MAARRRTSRFLLVTPADAVLVLQHPVTVDRLIEGEMWITSDFPVTRDDLFNFSRIGSNPVSNLRLRVTGSEPVIRDGVVRHRVRLAAAASSGPAETTVVGMLTKTIRVRLLEVAQTGCLFECSYRLDAAACGELHVDIDGERWSDQIRIRRCEPRQGERHDAYVTAAEFVWPHPVHDMTPRDVADNRDENRLRSQLPIQKSDRLH